MADTSLAPVLLAGRAFAKAYWRLPLTVRAQLGLAPNPLILPGFMQCLDAAEKASGWTGDSRATEILLWLVKDGVLSGLAPVENLDDLGTFFRRCQGFVSLRLIEPILNAATAEEALSCLALALPHVHENAGLDFGVLLRDLCLFDDGVRQRWIRHRFQ